MDACAKTKFNKLLIGVRERDSYDDGIRLDINVHDLFDLLKYTECLEDAFVAEEIIKETWKAHKDKNVRLRLDDGIADLLRGDKASALSIYEKIIEEDPEYLEAHNKKATCHYVSSLHAKNLAIIISLFSRIIKILLTFTDAGRNAKVYRSCEKSD